MISSDSNYYGAGAPTAGIGGTGGQNNFRYNVPNKTQAGNCYLVSATWPDGNTPVLSDNLNGVWPAPIGTVGVGQGNNVSGFFLLIGSLPGWMTITGMLNGMPTPPWQWNIKEFCHIIGSGGTSAGAYAQTGPNLTAGSFTPSNNNSGGGNLIVTYCCTSGANMVQTTAPSSFVPSSGHTLLEANITCIEVQASGGYGFAHAEEYYLQTTAAAINPGFTATGDTTNTYNVIAIALTAGPAGSPAPAYGPWINKIIHQSTLADAALTSVKFQVPWTGNLRFARALTGGNLAGLTLTDSDSYTWTNEASATGDLMGWAANTAADTNATLTIAGTAGSFGGGYTWVFYDIANMATSPFDQFASSTTYNSGNGGIPSNYGSLINVPTITPGVNYGLCISATGLGTGPGLTCSSPQGAVDDFMHYSGQNDNDNYDNADCGGHIDFRTDAPINWCYTITPGAGYTDGSYAITFAAATLPGPSGSTNNSGVVFMRDPDLSLIAWFNNSWSPIAEWFDDTYPVLVAATVSLLGRGFAMATGRGAIVGNARLVASGKGSAEGLVSFSGKVPVITRATSLAMARAQAGAMAALAAKANAQARANANPQGAVPLAARGTGLSAARAAPSGVVGLLARGVAAAFSRAGIGIGGLVALYARATAIGSAHGRSAVAAIGTPTLVGSGTNATSTSTLTFTTSATIVAENLVVIAIGYGSLAATISAISDGTNSYTKAYSQGESGVGNSQLWYCANAQAVSSGATVTVTGNTSVAAGKFVGVVAQVSGVAASSALDSAGNTNAGSSSTPSVATGTLAQASEIIFGVFGFSSSLTYATEAPGFTNLYNNVLGTTPPLALDYQIVSSNTAVTYAPGYSGNSSWDVLAAPFKAAAPTSVSGGQMTVNAALAAAARATGSGRSYLSGAVALAARGASSAKAVVTISLGGFVNLIAMSFASATGRASAVGKLNLSASGQSIGRATATSRGAVGLLALGTSSAKAFVTIRIGAFVNLVARGFTAAAGSAHATGKLGLSASAKAMGVGGAAPAGAVGLFSRGSAAAKATAAGGWRAALSARSTAIATGRISGSFSLALAALSRAAAAARTVLGVGAIVLLTARSMAKAAGALRPTLTVGLTAHAAASTTGSAAPIGKVALAGRATAAAMGWFYRRIQTLLPNPRFGSVARARRFGTAVKPRRFGTIARWPMPQSADCDEMDVGETVNGWIDFNKWLAPGETISSIVSVTEANYLPPGGSAYVTLTGSAQIGTVPVAAGGSGVTNAAVLQQWTGANPGTARITATVITSAGQELIDWTHQPVDTPD
jgi:hypothetical protein